MIYSRQILIIFSMVILLTQSACNAIKPKKVSAKDFPPDPRERVKKNIEEGRGFRVFGGNKSRTTYDFASSNVQFLESVSADNRVKDQLCKLHSPAISCSFPEHPTFWAETFF